MTNNVSHDKAKFKEKKTMMTVLTRKYGKYGAFLGNISGFCQFCHGDGDERGICAYLNETSEDLWRCPNGKCIHKEHRCNGIYNECALNQTEEIENRYEINNADESGCTGTI